MIREELYQTLLETNDVVIKDSTTVNWGAFKWTNGYYIHYITKLETERPYLISYAYYGVNDYMDVILLVNNIPDIFECVSGKKIYIPKIEDIKTFILESKS